MLQWINTVTLIGVIAHLVATNREKAQMKDQERAMHRKLKDSVKWNEDGTVHFNFAE